MAELAATVGLKTPSLYSHFSGKDEIVEAAVFREIAHCRTALETCAAGQQGTNLARLHGLFRFQLAYFQRSGCPSFWKNIMLIPDETVRARCAQELQRQNRWFAELLEKLFAAGQAAGEFAAADTGTERLYYSMLLRIVDVQLLAPSYLSLEQYADDAWTAFVRCLAAAPQNKG